MLFHLRENTVPSLQLVCLNKVGCDQLFHTPLFVSAAQYHIQCVSGLYRPTT